MRMRKVYVSHTESCGTWVNITKWQYGNFLENKEREYQPGKLSLRRLESLLSLFQPDHANFSRFHCSATWTFDGTAETVIPKFYESPEVERCISCGTQPDFLFEGMCSTCHNADMAVEEYENLHYERWLNGEE